MCNNTQRFEQTAIKASKITNTQSTQEFTWFDKQNLPPTRQISNPLYSIGITKLNLSYMALIMGIISTPKELLNCFSSKSLLFFSYGRPLGPRPPILFLGEQEILVTFLTRNRLSFHIKKTQKRKSSQLSFHTKESQIVNQIHIQIQTVSNN